MRHMLLQSVVRLWSVRYDFLDSLISELPALRARIFRDCTHYSSVKNVFHLDIYLQVNVTLDAIVVRLFPDKVGIVVLTCRAHL